MQPTTEELKAAALTLLEEPGKFALASRLYDNAQAGPAFETVGTPEILYMIETAALVHRMEDSPGKNMESAFLLDRLAALAESDLAPDVLELMEYLTAPTKYERPYPARQEEIVNA